MTTKLPKQHNTKLQSNQNTEKRMTKKSCQGGSIAFFHICSYKFTKYVHTALFLYEVIFLLMLYIYIYAYIYFVNIYIFVTIKVNLTYIYLFFWYFIFVISINQFWFINFTVNRFCTKGAYMLHICTLKIH